MTNTGPADALVFMGGTFDPVHNGHLRTALEIQQWMGVEQVCLIPSKIPVHREQPGCSSEQRLAMVGLAVEQEPALRVDAREVLSDQPSYSLLTLQSLRAEIGPDRSLCMVLGMDAYLGLASWHGWEQLPDYCHIIVVCRPGYVYEPDERMQRFFRAHETRSLRTVLGSPCGRVLMHELTPLSISATQIRQLVAKGLSPRYLCPDPVWHYMQQHKLYVIEEDS
ncbi:nicotinate-nucleotide adenylyltransferase [Marinobacterium sedimentorum]|uniref:nicotinate-nucleotide adenylyltransferase n=1 Tax=Marinobacterium sedimentorum TaxID=2927804 RepID=UPI0020C5D149|nr:nicotinate-nucleotide adenylyltransferase [Marinobacterium sedimentorum]MCP8686016.1 nicotinate-nucleotide adenylyltransferase [Marinobacterium sedimentorum]